MLRWVACAIRDLLVPIGPLEQRLKVRDRALRQDFESRLGELRREVKRTAKATERGAARLGADLERLGQDLESGLRQQELLLRRLEYLTTATPPATTTKSPAAASAAPGTSTLDRMADLPEDVWKVEDCPVCGHDESTLACEWNKFALIGGAPDEAAARYDYAVCHPCGILFRQAASGGGSGTGPC